MINEEIRDKEVRLIDNDGAALGIMSTKEAMALAHERELDLVKIAATATPPVCKIMDYGKYIFDLAKKEKDIKKNQKVVDIKEVKLGLGIGDHDFDVKIKNAIKFLQNGDKVKVTVKFVGREMNYTSAGNELLNKLFDKVSDVGIPDKMPKMEGKRLIAIINPKAQ